MQNYCCRSVLNPVQKHRTDSQRFTNVECEMVTPPPSLSLVWPLDWHQQLSSEISNCYTRKWRFRYAQLFDVLFV